jgi:hypothetical protein
MIEWVLMPRRHSASPPRHQLGVNGERKPVFGSGSGGSGLGAGGSGGLIIHRVTKEISSSGTFPTLMKTSYHDWSALM